MAAPLTHAAPAQPTLGVQATRRTCPLTLWVGLLIILVAEALLFVDVSRRGWVVIPTPGGQELPQPVGHLGILARYTAENMTPICWVGYLFLVDGLVTFRARRVRQPSVSALRARPYRFLVAWLTSIPVWCFFDWVNFYYMRAWIYHGLPPDPPINRIPGYFLAFAAISPGMFLAAQLYQYLGMRRLRTSGIRINRPIQIACFLMGVVFFIYPFVVGDPIACLTLWISVIFVFDPVNHWLGAPSIIGDWRAGRWGRTFSLMAAGATCGFCWEFWNYWALAKWTYHLPFLGEWERYRYFEMPWMGFMGFLPFAIECWVVLNTILGVLERAGVRVAEPLPDEWAVL